MKNILVVEDDVPNRLLLRLQLEDLDECEIHTAGDGVAGLALFDATQPAAVVLDINMPQLDGFGFLSALRETPGGQRVPVVVVTARFLDASDGQRLRALGVNKVFEKGRYDEDDLVDTLSGFLSAA